MLMQIRESHDFTTDEFIFEVRATWHHSSALITTVQEKVVTDWITPAAWGALVPFLMVHARTSSAPAVK